MIVCQKNMMNIRYLKKYDEYPVLDIHIEQLSDFNAHYLNNFSCHIQDLEDFLKEDALVQQKEGVNITYLWLSNADKTILSYVTICTDSINLHGEKREEMHQIGIGYKSLPAIKIARMAVHKNFVRRGIGSRMIAFAINIGIEISNQVGCRFLTLEAKNTPNIPEVQKPVHFYKKLGFQILKERKPNADYVHMYRDLGPLIKSVRISQTKNRLAFRNEV